MFCNDRSFWELQIPPLDSREWVRSKNLGLRGLEVLDAGSDGFLEGCGPEEFNVLCFAMTEALGSSRFRHLIDASGSAQRTLVFEVWRCWMLEVMDSSRVVVLRSSMIHVLR